MDATERAALLGDDLTRSVDSLVQLFWPGETKAPAVVSDFLVAVLQRVTSMAASTLLGVIERQDRLEERVAALEELVKRHVGQVPGDGDR